MNIFFNNKADKAGKNAVVVFTSGLVDSLSAAARANEICSQSDNQDAINVYFVDTFGSVFVEIGSDLANYSQNCHGIMPKEHEKTCHLFQRQLQAAYQRDSTCLTSTFSGGTAGSLYEMFCKEDADNFLILAPNDLVDHVTDLVNLATSCGQAITKRVYLETMCDHIPTASAAHSSKVQPTI
jgi:hypothetical protein